MLLALDCHYRADGSGRVAGVAFCRWEDPEPVDEYVLEIGAAAPYRPGLFYQRELPGLLALIESVKERPGVLMVDGYVWLGPQGNQVSAVMARDPESAAASPVSARPVSGQRRGMGARLWEAQNREVPVVGVAKSRYPGAEAVRVFRRASKRPLYITSAGLPLPQAALAVVIMHGAGRIPRLIQRADRLARGHRPAS